MSFVWLSIASLAAESLPKMAAVIARTTSRFVDLSPWIRAQRIGGRYAIC